jgi:hypothetical protein
MKTHTQTQGVGHGGFAGWEAHRCVFDVSNVPLVWSFCMCMCTCMCVCVCDVFDLVLLITQANLLNLDRMRSVYPMKNLCLCVYIYIYIYIYIHIYRMHASIYTYTHTKQKQLLDSTMPTWCEPLWETSLPTHRSMCTQASTRKPTNNVWCFKHVYTPYTPTPKPRHW